MRRHELALKRLAHESGVSEARLRKFLSNDPETVRTPQLHEALSIWAVLGADAASASLSAIGMTVADEEDGAPALGVALADMFGGGARLARAAADGEITPREADDAEHAADQVIEAATKLRRRARAARGKA